ncbi:MraZ protein [Thermodesulfobium acidiphilum]|uniref:Transcriptional regulator MraZ n=1 Tax=Thermodesulfobium acidiphilum TaxID=1794699 RepID=A0A2R4VZT4_THEAF|nr:division/cell wall cluster transcriptional repressor MraZ [Thermodesulfobium acidiphilum]AWB09996.1 MraZ protein [Thermodesulfobium acidiphilum]PMP84887.1 MAG: division/cell wall cluster transcriptional repressor MraZ [Thermodesulfobium narugense]
MLGGEYLHSLDSKGRVTIPFKLRDEISSKIILTRGFERCLYLYPVRYWEEYVEYLKEKSRSDIKLRDVIRFLFSGAYDDELDRAGRLLLPQQLREYSNIQKEVVVIGAMDRVELWNPEEWESQKKKISNSVKRFIENE